jgi:hypothetical protein
MHPNGIYCSTVAPLTVLTFTLGIFIAPLFDPLFFLHPVTLVISLATGAVLHMIISKHFPDQKVANPLAFAFFGFWWVINSFYLTVLSLLTFDFSDWGSRTKKRVRRPGQELCN